jgi:hypothetical protein
MQCIGPCDPRLRKIQLAAARWIRGQEPRAFLELSIIHFDVQFVFGTDLGGPAVIDRHVNKLGVELARRPRGTERCGSRRNVRDDRAKTQTAGYAELTGRPPSDHRTSSGGRIRTTRGLRDGVATITLFSFPDLLDALCRQVESPPRHGHNRRTEKADAIPEKDVRSGAFGEC